MAIGPSNERYIVGGFSDIVDFDSMQPTMSRMAKGPVSAYVLRCSEKGGLDWVFSWDAKDELTEAYGVCVGGDSLYITGNFGEQWKTPIMHFSFDGSFLTHDR